MTLLSVSTLAADADFKAKVDAASFAYALTVLAEADVLDTDGITPLAISTKRKGLANSVVSAAGPAMYLGVANTDPSTDANISTAVETLWNVFAGVTETDDDVATARAASQTENQDCVDLLQDVLSQVRTYLEIESPSLSQEQSTAGAANGALVSFSLLENPDAMVTRLAIQLVALSSQAVYEKTVRLDSTLTSHSH